MITIQSLGAQRLFDHPVYTRVRPRSADPHRTLRTLTISRGVMRMRTYVGIYSFQQSSVVIITCSYEAGDGFCFTPVFACCRKERFAGGALR